jgi:hypothetical protein
MAALASVVVAAAGVTDDDDNADVDDDMVDSCFRSFEFRKAEVAEQQQRMMRAQIEQDKLRMKPE